VPTTDGKLGVGVTGVGWCAAQHISAFDKNPHTRITWLHGRDAGRTRANLTKYEVSAPEARVTTRYEDLLEAPDVDIIAIATPNHLHASQAVAAARAGKHILLEKPTGLDVEELVDIRDAVRAAGVRTIVSFELRYNPFLRFAHWLRREGWLGEIRFARAQYLSRVTEWYAGWDWVRTRASGRSHLLAAGCHAVDALRWCSGREAIEVSAFHTRFTPGYEWPTSIIVNVRLDGGALGHVTSSTDFMLPYNFNLELMGDRATLRQELLQWDDVPIAIEALASASPFADISFEPATDVAGRPAIRVLGRTPNSADVAHHPFQAEIDELVACVLEGRDTSIDVFDAQKTMEICLAADRSAEEGGQPIALPLIVDDAAAPDRAATSSVTAH
jgi:predicted dehydrogenase